MIWFRGSDGSETGTFRRVSSIIEGVVLRFFLVHITHGTRRADLENERCIPKIRYDSFLLSSPTAIAYCERWIKSIWWSNGILRTEETRNPVQNKKFTSRSKNSAEISAVQSIACISQHSSVSGLSKGNQDTREIEKQ